MIREGWEWGGKGKWGRGGMKRKRLIRSIYHFFGVFKKMRDKEKEKKKRKETSIIITKNAIFFQKQTIHIKSLGTFSAPYYTFYSVE